MVCSSVQSDSNVKEILKMAKWRKKDSLGKALAREGKGIAKGVAKGLLSIATLGFYSPKKHRTHPRRWR